MSRGKPPPDFEPIMAEVMGGALNLTDAGGWHLMWNSSADDDDDRYFFRLARGGESSLPAVLWGVEDPRWREDLRWMLAIFVGRMDELYDAPFDPWEFE